MGGFEVIPEALNAAGAAMEPVGTELPTEARTTKHGRYRGIDFEGYLKPGADWATAGPDDIATVYPVM